MPPSTDALLEQLLAGLERELPRAVALRRLLHSQPELAHAEEQTAARIAAKLNATRMGASSVAAGGRALVSRQGPC